MLASLAGFSFLVNNGIDFRPKLAIILGLGLLDSVYLGGASLAQVLNLWPPYRRHFLVHEAGHILCSALIPNQETLGVERALIPISEGEDGSKLVVEEWVELPNGCVCCTIKHSIVQELEEYFRGFFSQFLRV